ncbi:MAG TPA: PD-(D/E)XK nuclease family protein [Dehalococcoidia bacterium]
MANLSQTLLKIAADRRADPLAPVTVIVPSHVAGIQMRRRLGEMGPFAAVRFETLPRLAEMIAAGELARRGRSPLARPIGDYVAGQVALLSRKELEGVAELPGYARVLRQHFRRIRRAGIASAEAVSVGLSNGYMAELVRLYGEFRARTAHFYDEEDLMDAAADLLASNRPGLIDDLGALYAVPPYGLSAAADRLLKALRRASGKLTNVGESKASAAQTFVLAPDPASEVREALREVIAGLEGAGIQEVAVFHGADPSYRKLLRDAFAAAGVPAALMPGIPLAETPAGRAVLALASLPAEDYSRTAVMDFLSLAPLRARIPGAGKPVAAQPATWDRLSRAAGVTKRVERWRSGLESARADLQDDLDGRYSDADDYRRAAVELDMERIDDLGGVIEALVARLEPLRPQQPAARFIESFKAAVGDYLAPDAPDIDKITAEIDQLGTVDAVGGSFGLSSFTHALRANLEVGSVRERGLGEGILVADYRLAAGMEFKHVVLCGAFEGSFPSGPGGDTLVDDGEWTKLRERHPFIEDATLRIERAAQAARRALAAASGSIVWTAPLYEPGGTREYYPSPLMVEGAGRSDPSIVSASKLRGAPSGGAIRRSPSPLAASLSGRPVSRSDPALREAVSKRLAGVSVGPGHRLQAPLTLLRARRSRSFTEFDGNVAALAGDGRLWTSRSASPTSLETYGGCGFKYMCGYVLRLKVVEEPDDLDVMDPAERGSLVHAVLESFFGEMAAQGRPQPGEVWTPADRRRLREIADQQLSRARVRGKTGREIFADHDAQTILGDLDAFLESDNEFRLETGAVPSEFEVWLPPGGIAGVEMRGVVDRIDRSPDGRRAWVIDYKTGSAASYKTRDDDPLAGGTRLQLAAYVAAAGAAEDVRAVYWFISRKGAFERVPYSPTAQNHSRFADTVKAIVDGVRSGAFPAVPGEQDDFHNSWENCRYCDFSRICSRSREQDFERISADEELAPWGAVGTTARELRP